MPKHDTLYYDGLCPLCVKEMDKLRKLKDSTLELADIHQLPDSHQFPGSETNPTPNRPDKETLLRVLHLERNGVFLTGIDANVAAWQHTRYGVLWRWMRWPGIRWLVELVYTRWAVWRYERLYGCDACTRGGSTVSEVPGAASTSSTSSSSLAQPWAPSAACTVPSNDPSSQEISS